MDIRELLEKAEKKLFKVRSVDPDCPLSTRGGGHSGIFWVGMCRTKLQIGTPF